jgi:hypothetical protein
MAFGIREQSSPVFDIPALTRVAVLVVSVLVTAAMAAHLIDFGVYDLRVRVMNAGLGTSPIAWVSPAAVLVAVGASALLARGSRRWSIRALPVALAIVLVLASDHLGKSVPHWQILLLPPLGLTLAVLWHVAANLHPSTGRVLRTGCLLLVIAFGLHVFGAPFLRYIGVGVDTWAYQVKVALKEGGEISGWMLVAFGLTIAGVYETSSELPVRSRSSEAA